MTLDKSDTKVVVFLVFLPSLSILQISSFFFSHLMKSGRFDLRLDPDQCGLRHNIGLLISRATGTICFTFLLSSSFLFLCAVLSSDFSESAISGAVYQGRQAMDWWIKIQAVRTVRCILLIKIQNLLIVRCSRAPAFSHFHLEQHPSAARNFGWDFAGPSAIYLDSMTDP